MRSSELPVARVRRFEVGGERARQRMEEVWAFSRNESVKFTASTEGSSSAVGGLAVAVKPCSTRS